MLPVTASDYASFFVGSLLCVTQTIELLGKHFWEANEIGGV